MPKLSARTLWGIVVALIAGQILLTLLVVHRESLTFDEDDHMFAGYMMWHTGDYGLNPEHPPLAKLLAALPLVGRHLWVPQLQGREFKSEAYLDGRDWLAHNDGDRNQLVFQMRLADELLSVGLSLVVFLAARECFGDWAGLVALVLVAFDPNVLAHSALVTTDIGVSLFFLASTWCFYRFVKHPTGVRLVVAGVVAGLLLATKHSGILLAPMLLLLLAREVVVARKGTRAQVAWRLAGAFCAIFAVAVSVLWGFYGFRYAARPNGLKMSTTLAAYVAPLGPHISALINLVARLRLLPESYLIGLVDVGRMAIFYPTYIFGKNLAHGVWWYFPSVIAIKSTLGLLALVGLAIYALAARKLPWSREVDFLLIPALFYLFVAVISGMNIGARHLLPLYSYLFVLVAGGAVALAASSRRWLIVCAVLIAAHVTSSLASFPNYMAYANAAWGGPANVHNLLSDSNADWGQQLFQVRAWQDRHPGQECWFAYFAYPEVDPATYGIRCQHLPSLDTFWLGGADNVPPLINGYVLISAGDLSGCEWPAASLNPYNAFRDVTPAETLDDSVMIFRGRFDIHHAAALARAENALQAVSKGDFAAGLSLAQEAVALDQDLVMGHSALGDALDGSGRKAEARKEWETALALARRLESGAQTMFVPDLEAKLKK
ncbi:MAG TPA: glycosyltransferase family 39 protein [Verrucomicrobiae bacterium]|nr:glycosyltransferase family 39 protein [Verrucomicrobiae bacterium]